MLEIVLNIVFMLKLIIKQLYVSSIGFTIVRASSCSVSMYSLINDMYISVYLITDHKYQYISNILYIYIYVIIIILSYFVKKYSY